MYKKITIDGTEYHLVPVEETETATTPEPKRTGLGKVDGVEADGWYYITCFNVDITKFHDSGCHTDKKIIENGNAYTDKQLAEDTARANRIRNALRDYAAKHNRWALDWEDSHQIKYYLGYNADRGEIVVYERNFIKADIIYFDSRYTAEAAIEDVGREDVTWLLRDFNPWLGAYKEG